MNPHSESLINEAVRIQELMCKVSWKEKQAAEECFRIRLESACEAGHINCVLADSLLDTARSLPTPTAL